MKKINVAFNKDIRILIIRFSSIGDILLSTPFIRQVKNTFPLAEVDYVVKDEFKELLDKNPYLNKIYTYQKSQGIRGLREIKKKLNKFNYTYVFDLHNNFRSNYLRRGLRADITNFVNKDKLRQIFYVYFKINLYKSINSIPVRYLNVAANYGVEDDHKGLELYWNSEDEKRIILLLKKYGIYEDQKYLCIAPGAGFYSKRWPLEYFAQLIEQIQSLYDYKIIVLGGEKDVDAGKCLANNRGIVDLTGKLDLGNVGIVLSKSKILIANDSGLMHMATAVKTPVLAIFGSSVKQFGFFPYRSKYSVLQNTTLECRPCSHIGRKKCPKKHFKCMRDISPKMVLQKFDLLVT